MRHDFQFQMNACHEQSPFPALFSGINNHGIIKSIKLHVIFIGHVFIIALTGSPEPTAYVTNMYGVVMTALGNATKSPHSPKDGDISSPVWSRETTVSPGIEYGVEYGHLC